MKYFYIFLVFISYISYVFTQKFGEESPYIRIRLMDLRLNEWKPEILDKMEKALDSELKYTDERKGIRCTSIDFEQQAGYPVQDARFLDLSIRGLCHDEYGTTHNIDKLLIIDALKRNIGEINTVTGATVFEVGDVRLYARDENILNWIIIPISLALILLLFGITFALRFIRNKQKRKHIVSVIEKRRQESSKNTSTVPNPDPFADENQRLVQLDPNVVGNASDTLGSPKEFTTDQNPSPTRTKQTTSGVNRGGPATTSVSKGNQRTEIPFDHQTRLLPSQSQPQYEQSFPDMIPLQEQQPRVTVKTIREANNPPQYYQNYEEPSTKFVSIPVQIEQSSPRQAYMPPYHSDPYYRHTNA